MTKFQTTETGSVIVFANPYDGAILAVIAESEKAIHVRNTENGKSCWLPKSGLKPRKPGVPTYEGEYVLAPWFSNVRNNQQERVLNLLE